MIIAGGYSYSRNWWDSTNRIVTPQRHHRESTRESTVTGGVVIGGIANHYGHAFVDFVDRVAQLTWEDVSHYKYLAILGPIIPTVKDLLTSTIPWFGQLELLDVCDGPIHADTLLLAENVSEKPFWAPTTIRHLGNQKIAAPVSDQFSILLITRKNVSQRKVLNEEALINQLHAKGYRLHVFAPEQHSLNQQIHNFSAASVIIGTIGSSLFNAVFASAKCKLIVCLVSEKYLTADGDNVSMIRSLAANLKVRLVFLSCQSLDSSYDSDLQVTTIAANQLSKLVDGLAY